MSLKLNLGCGRRQLEGWEGVDIEDYGQEHVADVRDLSDFKDNSVDEILAVHIIEHFYRWEVPDVLREWLRVLKPGGQINLEAPDLGMAVNRMAAGIDDPPLTLWVLYGDPNHQDPYQCHKWGWTPHSLYAEMVEAGFVDVHVKPAEFKYKALRDMRVEGRKPHATD